MTPAEMLSMAFTMAASATGFAIALYALHLAICTRIECRAMKESTHAVQFVPLDPTKAIDNDEDADAANTLGEHLDMDRLGDIHEREEPLN